MHRTLAALVTACLALVGPALGMPQVRQPSMHATGCSPWGWISAPPC